MHASTMLLALALVPLAFPQAGAPPQERPGTPVQGGQPRTGAQGEAPKDKRDTGLWPWGNTREAQRIEREFCGVWQLFRADLDGFTYLGPDCHGYLIAQPGYCALQFRVFDRDEGDRNLVIPAFAAGTYRWKYDATRLLVVLDTLLGTDDLESLDGVVRYERPGFTREYRVVLAGDELTLERGNESRLSFRRVPDAPRLPEPEPIDAREPEGAPPKEPPPRGGR
jgi:hypothetical protein